MITMAITTTTKGVTQISAHSRESGNPAAETWAKELGPRVP